jgi:hypothetical protein
MNAEPSPPADPPQPTQEQEGSEPTLPYSKWWPVISGAITGVALRLVFSGKAGAPYSAMMSSFVLLVPLLVGAVTVYVAERKQRRSWAYCVWAPLLANVLFVLGTMAIMIEGLICAILIVPLFGFVGVIGGLAMGAVCRKTHWPRQTLYTVAVLPFILGGLEQRVPLPDRERVIEHTRVVNASPEAVWRQLENAPDIAPEEVERAWVYRIGVPIPKAGITEQTAEGRVRRITMGSGIHFDQLATQWQPNRHVRWANRFAPDSFPPHALDDHVMIGGRYFGIGDTEYTLNPMGTTTELRMTVRYRLSTSFNWYAGPVLDFLIGNFEHVILGFYARRAESDSARKAVHSPGGVAHANSNSLEGRP